MRLRVGVRDRVRVGVRVRVRVRVTVSSVCNKEFKESVRSSRGLSSWDQG